MNKGWRRFRKTNIKSLRTLSRDCLTRSFTFHLFFQEYRKNFTISCQLIVYLYSDKTLNNCHHRTYEYFSQDVVVSRKRY